MFIFSFFSATKHFKMMAVQLSRTFIQNMGNNKGIVKGTVMTYLQMFSYSLCSIIGDMCCYTVNRKNT